MQNQYETFLVQFSQECKNTNYSSTKKIAPSETEVNNKRKG